MLNNGSYTYAYSSKSYQNIIRSNISVMNDKHFWVSAGDWKLAPGTFIILLKYGKIQPFFIVNIYIFKCPLFTFSKNETVES